MPLPPEFERYLDDFAAGRYFEAHEHLEGLWWARASDPFLQGLILFAAAYVKLQRGNADGARRHFAAAARYLEPYGERARGVDLRALRAQIHSALRSLDGTPDGPDLLLRVPPFAFTIDRTAGAAWEVPAPPLPAGELERLIAEEIAARRRRGDVVGPASWGTVLREMTRRVGGRVPREELRAAVRRALEPPTGSP